MLSNAMKNPEVNPVVSFSNNDIDKERAARNAEYLAMLDKSLKEIEEGKIVEVSAEEMRRILSEQTFFRYCLDTLYVLGKGKSKKSTKNIRLNR